MLIMQGIVYLVGKVYVLEAEKKLVMQAGALDKSSLMNDLLKIGSL